jgi:DNA-directed RNA polymerase
MLDLMRILANDQRRSITFASVHDSYWTHASSVEGMSELIRDTFIHLHSADLIGELRAEVRELQTPSLSH